MKPCGMAAWHIKEVNRPSGRKTSLVRIQIAVWNEAATDFYGNSYQSYAKKWLIAESGDYIKEDLTQERVDRYLNRIKRFQRIARLEHR